jgi:SAM-dependent methyltransferase
VPPAGSATLDVGCGEGRVARDLAGHGHRVTGVDASPTLIEAARQAHPAGAYVLADAADLPFPDASFDLVIAYNSLMDVDDLPGAVREAARVLAPGGRLVLSVLHPANTGATLGDGAALAFVVGGSYFEVRKDQQEAERGGLHMVFTSYHHPLSSHTGALEEAGFLIEAIREPRAAGADGSVSALPWHLRSGPCGRRPRGRVLRRSRCGEAVPGRLSRPGDDIRHPEVGTAGTTGGRPPLLA